mmetsp:Transcript_6882/g.12298  ORF Transcript_6882/g.12298 Transcript_6882/m.12298 type:complete len:126 (+) Transcript_6882:1040-1417(+)
MWTSAAMRNDIDTSNYVYSHVLNIGKSGTASEVFIFPHALVFASSHGNQKIDQIIKGIAALFPSVYKNSIGSWCTSGKECPDPNVGGITLKHITHEQFMANVQEKGCSWYPLFSEKRESSILNGV